MAEHNWPAGLPCFAVDGYGRSGEDGVIRSQFPGGMKIRNQFTSPPPEQVSATIYCTPGQVQTVVDFWQITLQRTKAFNMRDHTKPNDATTVEYRFTARPTYTPAQSGSLYRVSLSLEKMSTFQGTFPLSAGESLLEDGSGNLLTT